MSIMQLMGPVALPSDQSQRENYRERVSSTKHRKLLGF